MTERQFALFVFVNLIKQLEAWSWVVKDMTNHRLKQIHGDAQKHLTRFVDEMEKELQRYGEDVVEQWDSDSEVFSKVLEQIRKAETVEKKQELYLIMKEHCEGRLKLVETPPEAA